MKNKLIFPVLTILITLTTSVNATDVGGIISSNTTWTLLNSPYNLTSDIQIAEDKTLLIEPGCVVNGNGKYIKVWGALNAVGAQGATITFKPM